MESDIQALLASGVYYVRLPDDAFVSAKILKRYIHALREATLVRHNPAEPLEAPRETYERLGSLMR